MDRPKGPLHNNSEGLGRYLGITILNKTNSDKPADRLYHFTFPVVNNDAFGTTFQGFLDGDLNPLSSAEANTGVNSGGTTVTWSTESKTVFSSDGNVAVTIGDMSANNIGIRRYDLSSGTLSADIPPQFEASNYSDPGTPDSRTSLIVGIGRNGSEQKIYAGIMSRFPASDAEGGTRPYPAVTVSTDNGVTWSSLDILPVSVVRAYATANGANPDSTLFPYNQAQDVFVTGTDEYSFIMNMFEVNADRTDGNELRQLVEVYHNSNGWGIRKIADISGIIFTFDPIAPATTRANQVANEAHVSVTADGKFYLVKWVEIVNIMMDQDINGDGNTPDTLQTSDVFVTGRPSTSTN
ncbi:MAG TPA: hypothetical protein VHI13_02345 [Candidatus Kapabacteria bacterium]|nr:hypothetical protein [Candidatus Kapabacteria bacterium]